jgi:3-dehydroquinate synthase
MQALKANLHKATFFGRTPQEIENMVVPGAKDDDHGLIGMGLMLQRRAQSEITPSIAMQDSPGVLMRYQLQESYPVINTEGLLDPGNRLLAAQCPNMRATVVLDSNVDKLYGARINAYLRANSISYSPVVLAATEMEKDLAAVLRICAAAEETIAGRRDPFIAIGGGIVQDVTGFAASMFRRGVPFIRVPTTLIGIVDAGVGVKQGINWMGHKNFLGAFYPPQLVLNDLAFLQTLELRQWRCGLAEMIKMGIVRDAPLFGLLETHYSDFLSRQITDPVRRTIDMAIMGMLEELQPNIYEWDLERRVDFGHAFGHILEIQSQFSLHHGEAVAIDMALSTHIAYQRGECDENTLKRILLLLAKAGLPLYHVACDPQRIWNGLADVAAHRGGKLNLVVPTGIGSAAFLDRIKLAELKAAVAFMRTEMEKTNA